MKTLFFILKILLIGLVFVLPVIWSCCKISKISDEKMEQLHSKERLDDA